MKENNLLPQLADRCFRKIYLIENRNYWTGPVREGFDPGTDLVLCLDLGLLKDLEATGAFVYYADNILTKPAYDRYNVLMHDFISRWHKGPDGDVLQYKQFGIGDALTLNVLNDITHFCHLFFNLAAIRQISHDELYVHGGEIITGILDKARLTYSRLNFTVTAEHAVYSFPITKWMHNNIYNTSLRFKLKSLLASVLDRVFLVTDRITTGKKKRIYIHHFYCTAEIIRKLQAYGDSVIVFENYSKPKEIFRERRILFKKYRHAAATARNMMQRYDQLPKLEWKEGEYDLSDLLFSSITPVLSKNLEAAIWKADSISDYFKRNPIDLMVPVTNIWLDNRLVMQYCFSKQVPVFLIINGLLTLSFWSDARDSDWVNCYSESIKQDYFFDALNALPLGDPRMDHYVDSGRKHIDRENPCIVIGAAGFSLLDLNSYLAVEFSFLFDILSALRKIALEGKRFKLILKVRSNGYKDLYQSMIEEYFPQLTVRIEQDRPFSELISIADLYISFFSQTIIEASALGIPVIYYSNNGQIANRPFDGKSEVVSADTTDEMYDRILKFYKDDPCFDSFMQKEILQKYIGPLDGKNGDRNVSFIRSLAGLDQA